MDQHEIAKAAVAFLCMAAITIPLAAVGLATLFYLDSSKLQRDIRKARKAWEKRRASLRNRNR